MSKAFILLAFTLSSIGLRAQDEIITATDPWDWLHPTDGADPAVVDADFGSTWHSFTGYDGPSFTSGAAPFAYGTITYFTNNALVPTDLGTPASGNRFTAYFKKQINLPADRDNLVLQLLADDGAIIYIDGAEVRRVNVAGTAADTPDTYMLMSGPAVSETVLNTVNLGSLAAGDHVIAVSLHNADTASSDLGFYFRLLGSTPPVRMLRTDFGGVMTDVMSESGYTGWNADPFAGDVRMVGAGGTLHTIRSQPVDLTAVGECHFTVQLYCVETSTGSNFEDVDELSARLEVTFDDNATGELSLIPAALDPDANGKLNGGAADEFNPQLVPVTGTAILATQLGVIVPANVKSARLSLSALNDSPSESFGFGGGLLSDVPAGSDDDRDGQTREAELFAGTDPADALSYLRIMNVTLAPDATTGNYELTVFIPERAGKRYGAETSTDFLTWEYQGAITAGADNPSGGVVLDLGATTLVDPRFFLRVRAVP